MELQIRLVAIVAMNTMLVQLEQILIICFLVIKMNGTIVIDYRPFDVYSTLFIFDKDKKPLYESKVPSDLDSLADYVISYAYSYEAFDVTMNANYAKVLKELLLPREKSQFSKNQINIRS